ncbi:MAG: hypothetical protein WDO74_16930 [Pseudomonadota bacterium]
MTDLDILTEGRKRLRTSAPSLTDEQFTAWCATARSRGATFALTLEGVVARYDITDAGTTSPRVSNQGTNQ